MREVEIKTEANSPERILEEAVERNEQSIRRIQLRIQNVKAALGQLEELKSSLSSDKTTGGASNA